MLKEVQIFKDSVFQMGTRLKFHQLETLKLDSRNFSQGDSQGVSFTTRSHDLACSGVVPPLVGGLSVVPFYLCSAADMSIAPLITQ